MSKELPCEFPFDPKCEVNRMVFDHIKGLYAHPDVAETLADAVKPLGDVQLFCPDASGCRYLTASTQGVIFGFAIEMDTIAFRLNPLMRLRAIETGGRRFPECGEDWISFLPFRCDWPNVDLPFWARKAYVSVRESVGLA